MDIIYIMDDPTVILEIDYDPSEELVVKPIEVEKNEPINISPNFPQHPTLLYMAAPMSSGKTS